MAEHSMSKLLWTWTIVILAVSFTTTGATVSSADATGKPRTPTSKTTGVSSLSDLYRRQARDGGRRDYRCLNCPNTDERARYFDHMNSYYYYRQVPSYETQQQPARSEYRDRNWYYQPEYYEDRARYSTADRGYESTRNRYDDRGYGYGATRYDDRDDYYGRRPSTQYGVQPYQDTRYSDYRGNGYDNRSVQQYYGSGRYGTDQYYREPAAPAYDNRYMDERDYDRGGDYGGRGGLGGRGGGDYSQRVRDRDYINGNRDYYSSYNNNNNNNNNSPREYGSAGGYGSRGGGYYRGGASDYYDAAGAAYAYPGGNRFQGGGGGYDNRNFKPWDESYRGTSGFDDSGRGYYFANKRQPTSHSNARPDVDSQSFQVSSHYFVPTTHNSSPSPSSSSSGSSASPSSTSTSSGALLNVSPTSPHHHLGGSTISSGSASPSGSGSGYGGVGRYADRNRDTFRSDKDLQSSAYGVPLAVRHQRPQGSYLFERGSEDAAGQHDAANAGAKSTAMLIDEKGADGSSISSSGSAAEATASRLTDDNRAATSDAESAAKQ